MATPGVGTKMGDAYVTVSVDASQVGPELEAKVDTALEGVVASADTAMAEVGASAQEAAAKVAEAFDQASSQQQAAFLRAASAAESASSRVVTAQNAQRDAIARVTAAEAELAAAREKGDTEKAVEAEANLLTARGKAEVAAGKVSAATAAEAKAKADLTVATDTLTGSEETLATKSATAAETIGTKWAAMGSLVAGATAVVLVKSAGDYQASLTKLVTTAGESTTNIKAVGDGMLSMAGQVGIGAQTLATGMYTVESAGFHGADGLTVLKAAAQGAKQENADLGKVTDAVTTALHDYSLPASDAATVTSQLITAVSHGKTNFDELTGSMHSVTPLAASMKMSLAETAGALSAMTASGMSADQASQNLADALRHLQSPTAPMTQELAQLGITSGDLSKNLGTKGLAGTVQEVSAAILQHMGPSGSVMLSAFNQSKQAAQDADVMFQNLPASLQKMATAYKDGSLSVGNYRTALKAMPADQQNLITSWKNATDKADGFSQILKSGGPATQTYTQALQKAMGTSAGLSVALQLTGEHAAGVNGAIADIANAVPQADGSIKGWSEVQGNFNQQLAETWAGIQSWAIQLGQHLLPIATQVIGAVKDLVSWMGQHATTMKVIGGILAGLIAAFLVYKTTVGAIALGTKAWEMATGLATAAQKLLGIATAETSAAMDINPIGLLVVAIAALVVGIIYAWNHFTWFRDAIKDTGAALADAAQWVAHMAEVVWTALGAALDWVKSHWPLLLEILAGPIGWAIALFTNFGPQILHALEAAGSAILGWVEGLGPQIMHGLQAAGTAVVGWIADVGSWFAALPGKVWDALASFGPKVAAAIGNGLVTALGLIANFVVSAVMFYVTLPIKVAIVLAVLGEKIAGAFKAAFDYLVANVPVWIDGALQFFRDLPGKVWDAIVTVKDKLHDAFWQAIDAVAQAISGWFDSTMQFFSDLPGNIWNAIVTIKDKLHDAFWNAIDAVGSAIAGWFEATMQFFRDLPGKIWDAIVTIDVKLHDAFWNAFDKAKQVVSQGVSDIVNFVKALPGDIAALAGDMLNAGGKLMSSFLSGLAHVGSEVADIGKAVANAVIGFINSHVIDSIDSALDFSVMGVSIHAGVIPHIPQFAEGGVVNGPTLAVVGEDGPEAIVPLTKPNRAAQVMGAAGLGGGSGSGGGRGMTLNVTNNVAVARQATAEQVVAAVSDKVMRSLRLGDDGVLAGAGAGW